MSALGEVIRARIDRLVRNEPQPGVTYPEVLVVDDPLRAVRWVIAALDPCVAVEVRAAGTQS